VLDQKVEHPMIVNRVAFAGLLKRMTIISDDSHPGAVFTFHSNMLRVVAANPNIGESIEEMEIEYAGDTIEAAFNPQYFLAVVNNLAGENITIKLASGESPCIITDNSGDSVFAVMPMRI
jgi:DNA polymerase-3 subunit beta